MGMGMGMGMGMAFGATPPELGFRPLTLQYELGPNSAPSFPDKSLPTRAWQGRIGPWDPDVLSLLFLIEFIEKCGPGWKAINLAGQQPDLLGWQSAANSAFVNAEIHHLQQLMQTDRERYMAEIVIQHDNAPAYWVSMLSINSHAHFKTLVVMNLAVRIGQIVAAYYKKKYKRPRPSFVCPGLVPAFGPPAHASFPSAHSLQSWLLSLFLAEVLPDYSNELNWLATRVAFNRERAGVHYPSDTAAGEFIARACRNMIKTPNQCPDIIKLFGEAKAEWDLSISSTPPTSEPFPGFPP
ncbi:phosphatase PAP2 family protein [Bradyrhizobium hipponense]|uniref:Phosphatase PAP2 family protein n=1 Tax=Bradyrhizobium hipponense TaxID=2605638 RepID=A0A5S4YV46_9BRAD|nr:phosphatase PAP2 family protein [Bradyrhizobium hipponense]TYO67235.1 phosphatase PAP2 family protein [Bradyrhizobium hipponense]